MNVIKVQKEIFMTKKKEKRDIYMSVRPIYVQHPPAVEEAGWFTFTDPAVAPGPPAGPPVSG